MHFHLAAYTVETNRKQTGAHRSVRNVGQQQIQSPGPPTAPRTAAKPGPKRTRRSKHTALYPRVRLARWRPRDNHGGMTELQNAPQDPRAEFIKESVWHGRLDRAREILAAYPEVASSDIHTAALLGEDESVARFLAEDPANATTKGGPRNWDALTHLCFSKFLRLEPARSEGFLKTARALLDAGANPNTGFFEENHKPEPEWECALYGAAGVAHHPELTKLLLDRGADPNDGEVAYHSPETLDNRTIHVQSMIIPTSETSPCDLCRCRARAVIVALARGACWYQMLES